VYGGSGDDSLLGEAGDDFCSETSQRSSLGRLWQRHAYRARAPTSGGGAGIDTVRYEGSFAAIYINLATNTARGGDAEGDVFSSIENVIGTASTTP